MNLKNHDLSLKGFGRRKLPAFLALLAASLTTGLLQQTAGAAKSYAYRNIYGFINTPGDDEGDIASVVVHDDTAGGDMGVWYTLKPVGGSNGFKWTCGHLLTNHEYHLTVTDQDEGTYRVNFYLPSGWGNDQQVATLSVR